MITRSFICLYVNTNSIKTIILIDYESKQQNDRHKILHFTLYKHVQAYVAQRQKTSLEWRYYLRVKLGTRPIVPLY